MKIETCIHYDSDCYKKAQKASPVGIMAHSTGCNNNTVKRYVQPSKSDPDYKRLLDVIGVNKYGNSWNRPNVNKAVHFFIGKLAGGSVGCAQILPADICCWGCGSGKKGSYNYNPAYLQFEICEDDLKSKEYFNAAYAAAVELCAYLCKKFNWTADAVISHKEAYKDGYASNHADIDHWLKKYGLTMNDFRKAVEEKLKPIPAPIKPPAVGPVVYSVVKGDSLWNIAKKHLGSGLKYTQIKKLNGLKTNTIRVGQKLILPNK